MKTLLGLTLALGLTQGAHTVQLTRRLPRRLREVASASSIFDTLLQSIEAGPRSTTPTISERPGPLVQPHDGTRSSSRASRPRAAAAATAFSPRACVGSCRRHRICREFTQRPRWKAAGNGQLSAAARQRGRRTRSCVPALFTEVGPWRAPTRPTFPNVQIVDAQR